MTDNVIGFPHGFNGDGEGPTENVIEFRPDFSIPAIPDMINHPPHYQHNGIETIEILEHIVEIYKDHPKLGFSVASACKYLLRAVDKHETPLADLSKALWFIRHAIELASGTPADDGA